MPNGGEGPGEKHALSEMERQTAAAFIIQRSFRCFIVSTVLLVGNGFGYE